MSEITVEKYLEEAAAFKEAENISRMEKIAGIIKTTEAIKEIPVTFETVPARELSDFEKKIGLILPNAEKATKTNIFNDDTPNSRPIITTKTEHLDYDGVFLGS